MHSLHHRWARHGLAVLTSLLAGSALVSRTLPATPSMTPAPADSLRPYATVITAAAETWRGLLVMHRVGDRLYLEIPAKLLGVDLLLAVYQRYGWTQSPIRFERLGTRIALHKPGSFIPDDSVYVRWMTEAPRYRMPSSIVSVFPIETVGVTGDPVIDVTRLFTVGIADFDIQKAADERRSFVERVRVSPDNVIIEAVRTRSDTTAGATMRLVWNIIRLPEIPMRPRLYDPRAGYFVGTSQEGRVQFNLKRDERHGYMLRWRMEKRDPSAPVSEPIKPIVFYLDPATPAKWRSWIKAGVNAWRAAFDAAGFRNAIRAEDAPPGDSAWSIYDARYSVVYWNERLTSEWLAESGANGDWLIDHRTGEIIKADVRGLGVGTIQTWCQRYFAWVAPLDRRVWGGQCPDSVAGAMLQWVVSHEVGHLLGLEDGHYGKFAYPVDSLRSRSWVRRMGFTPSVMNYSRFNYVAQPEDSMSPADLVQRVGPADVYAVQWGYTPIPEARTPADERPTFDQWARAQDSVRWFRVLANNGSARIGPYTMDALDDDDPVRSAGFGLRNLRRVIALLPGATQKPGEDFAEFVHTYDDVLALWYSMHERVASLIGGFVIQPKSGGQTGDVYTPIPARQQREAICFLDSSVFRPPLWLANSEMRRRLEPTGNVDRVIGLQARALRNLLSIDRMHRLVEQQIHPGSGSESERPYTLAEFLEDVRRSVWRELDDPRVRIDLYRQGVQAVYLAHLERILQPSTLVSDGPRMIGRAVNGGGFAPMSAYQRAALRSDLQHLRAQLARAAARTAPGVTRAHLEMALASVDRILSPNNSTESTTRPRP